MTPLRAWPSSERPRERLLGHGPDGLADTELLALVVGAGSARASLFETCRALLARAGGLEGLRRCSPGELMREPGIGAARACALSAAIEIARRLEGRAPERGVRVAGAAEVWHLLRSKLSSLTQETFWVLALDARHRLLALRQVAQGSATAVEVHPREAFAPLVREGAAFAIVAHNHPSGDPEPSADDRRLSTRLRQAGRVLGIPLLDHVVVAAGGFVSLAARGVV